MTARTGCSRCAAPAPPPSRRTRKVAWCSGCRGLRSNSARPRSASPWRRSPAKSNGFSMFGDIQLAREAADARSLSARVGDLCPALDDTFGDAGRRLVDAVNALNSIITAFEGLPNALNDEQFQSAKDTLRRVATRLGTIHQVMPREMALLNEMILLGRDIASRLQGLQRHSRTIEILAVNTRIESAALKEGADEFSGFVSDLLRLAKAVKSITEADLASHTEMAATLHAARAQLEQFDRQHQMELPSFAQELERSLATIERRNA